MSLTITVGHFFSENAFHIEFIVLNNKINTFSNNNEIAEIFSKHFSKLKENLDMNKTLTSIIGSSDITDPVFKSII